MDENHLQVVEEAMVTIQKSLSTITKTAEKLGQLEGNGRDVLAAMTQLTNKVTSLEAKMESLGSKEGKRSSTITVPLYIKVTKLRLIS